MATYPEYEYESSDFNNRSPRMYGGKNEQQNLGFLDVFDDENDDWANYKHEEQKLLYRRGVTYSVILSLLWIVYVLYNWTKFFIATAIAIAFACSIPDVSSALYAVWFPAVPCLSEALECRPSSIPTDPAHTRDSSTPQESRPRNRAGAAPFTVRADRYRVMHPDEPNRLWDEALYDGWLNARRDLKAALLYRVPYILTHTLSFMIIFQFLITLMQTLGVHFREGEDSVGVVDRFLANLLSTQNWFGIRGLTGVGALYVFRARWLWGSIVLFTGSAWNFLLRADSIPGEYMSDEEMRASGISSIFRETAKVTHTSVGQ